MPPTPTLTTSDQMPINLHASKVLFVAHHRTNTHHTKCHAPHRDPTPPHDATPHHTTPHLHAGGPFQRLDPPGRFGHLPVAVPQPAEAAPPPREDLAAVRQHRRVLPPTAHLSIKHTKQHQKGSRQQRKGNEMPKTHTKRLGGDVTEEYGGSKRKLCVRPKAKNAALFSTIQAPSLVQSMHWYQVCYPRQHHARPVCADHQPRPPRWCKTPVPLHIYRHNKLTVLNRRMNQRERR